MLFVAGLLAAHCFCFFLLIDFSGKSQKQRAAPTLQNKKPRQATRAPSYFT
jgi:hypothetical protein